MKRNKAMGPDQIATEIIVALDDFGLEKLTESINEIYDNGEVPKDLSKSIFIALPKKNRNYRLRITQNNQPRESVN